MAKHKVNGIPARNKSKKKKRQWTIATKKNELNEKRRVRWKEPGENILLFNTYVLPRNLAKGLKPETREIYKVKKNGLMWGAPVETINMVICAMP